MLGPSESIGSSFPPIRSIGEEYLIGLPFKLHSYICNFGYPEAGFSNMGIIIISTFKDNKVSKLGQFFSNKTPTVFHVMVGDSQEHLRSSLEKLDGITSQRPTVNHSSSSLPLIKLVFAMVTYLNHQFI